MEFYIVVLHKKLVEQKLLVELVVLSILVQRISMKFAAEIVFY
jgi:hypothetical protein